MNKHLLIMLFSLLLFSCREESINEIPKLTFWHFWSEPNQSSKMDSLISIFEYEYKCDVEITRLSWNDGKKKLMAAFNSGTAPDVLELGSDWVAQFSSSGVLLELDSVNMDKFVPFTTSPCYWNNKIFALPWIIDTRAVFYNLYLLKKAGFDTLPRNLDELLVVAEKVNSLEGVYGFGANGSDRHRLYKKILSMFWTYGGNVFDESGKLVINSDENVKALEHYLKLADAGMIDTQRQLDDLFAKGRIGIWFSGGWLIEKINNINPDLSFEIGLFPGMGDKPGISFAGGEYFAISKDSENKNLANKLIRFLTDGANAIIFTRQIFEAGFPADKDYYRDSFYESHPKRMLFARQLESARMTPVSPYWLEIEEIIESNVEKTLYDEISPSNAIAAMEREINAVMK